MLDILSSPKMRRKPLVGHNCYQDLVRVYAQFVDILPEGYSAFKSSVRSLFPLVFDTKHVMAEMRRWMEQEDSGLASQ